MSRVKGGTVTHARHKKLLKLPRDILALEKMYLKQPHRLLIKPTNMRPVTGRLGSVILGACGFSVSMLEQDNTI